MGEWMHGHVGHISTDVLDGGLVLDAPDADDLAATDQLAVCRSSHRLPHRQAVRDAHAACNEDTDLVLVAHDVIAHRKQEEEEYQ